MPHPEDSPKIRQRGWSRNALVLALALVACGRDPVGCEEDRQVVELVPASIWYDYERARLNWYETAGYRCRPDGAVRDARGREIGTRYVCTRCS